MFVCVSFPPWYSGTEKGKHEGRRKWRFTVFYYSSNRATHFHIINKKRKKTKNMYRIEGLTAHGYERCFDFVLGTRNAVKLAASAGNPSAAVAASAHPPVLWSSRRKPGKSICIRILFPTRIFISHPCLTAKLNAKRTFASPARFLAKVQLLRAGGSKLLLLFEKSDKENLS